MLKNNQNNMAKNHQAQIRDYREQSSKFIEGFRGKNGISDRDLNIAKNILIYGRSHNDGGKLSRTVILEDNSKQRVDTYQGRFRAISYMLGFESKEEFAKLNDLVNVNGYLSEDSGRRKKSKRSLVGLRQEYINPSIIFPISSEDREVESSEVYTERNRSSVGVDTPFVDISNVKIDKYNPRRLDMAGWGKTQGLLTMAGLSALLVLGLTCNRKKEKVESRPQPVLEDLKFLGQGSNQSENTNFIYGVSTQLTEDIFIPKLEKLDDKPMENLLDEKSDTSTTIKTTSTSSTSSPREEEGFMYIGPIRPSEKAIPYTTTTIPRTTSSTTTTESSSTTTLPTKGLLSQSITVYDEERREYPNHVKTRKGNFKDHFRDSGHNFGNALDNILGDGADVVYNIGGERIVSKNDILTIGEAIAGKGIDKDEKKLKKPFIYTGRLFKGFANSVLRGTGEVVQLVANGVQGVVEGVLINAPEKVVGENIITTGLDYSVTHGVGIIEAANGTITSHLIGGDEFDKSIESIVSGVKGDGFDVRYYPENSADGFSKKLRDEDHDFEKLVEGAEQKQKKGGFVRNVFRPAAVVGVNLAAYKLLNSDSGSDKNESSDSTGTGGGNGGGGNGNGGGGNGNGGGGNGGGGNCGGNPDPCDFDFGDGNPVGI